MCCLNGEKLGITSSERLRLNTDLTLDIKPLNLPDAVIPVAADFEMLTMELRRVTDVVAARELLFDAFIFCDSLRRIVERIQQDKLREMSREGK